jgi:peptidyl-prolyl cis-trans isomerase C
MNNKFSFLLIIFFICCRSFAEVNIYVNESVINNELINYIKGELEIQGKEVSDEMKTNIKDRLIELEVITQKAVEDGITNESKFLSKVELTYMEMAYTEYLKDFLKKNPIKEEEIKKTYSSYVKNFKDIEFNGKHILVKSKNEANQIYKRIQAGEEFQELAKNLSLDKSSKDNGGELGWFSKKEMVDGIIVQAEQIELNKLSDPFQTQFGWHLLVIAEKRKLKAPELKDIRKKIIEKAQKIKLKKHIDELKREANIEK